MKTDGRKNNGGYRPGAGRKPREIEVKTVTFKLPVETLEKLSSLSERSGKPRWQIVAELIDKESCK